MKLVMMLVKLVAVLAIVVVGVGFFLPADWECSTTVVVDAKPAEIQPLVADLRRWDSWSAWNSEADPTLTYSYSGAPAGQGQVQDWTSEDMGNGHMEITAASAEGMEYFLTFEGMDDTIHGKIWYETEGEGTTVHWDSWGQGDGKPWSNALNQIFVPMITADLEKGLAKLKTKVEGGDA